MNIYNQIPRCIWSGKKMSKADELYKEVFTHYFDERENWTLSHRWCPSSVLRTEALGFSSIYWLILLAVAIGSLCQYQFAEQDFDNGLPVMYPSLAAWFAYWIFGLREILNITVFLPWTESQVKSDVQLVGKGLPPSQWLSFTFSDMILHVFLFCFYSVNTGSNLTPVWMIGILISCLAVNAWYIPS